MIRTFGIGPRSKKRRFWAFGLGPRAKIVGKSQGKRKNNALGKMTNFGPFLGPWMAKSCQKRRPCFDIFPMFSVFLCICSRLLDHVFSLFYFPYLLISSYFYYKYGTIQHATYTLTTTHAHTTCTPATDRDLESGLSKSHTQKNPRKMPEKGKVRRISGEVSLRYRRVNRSSAAKWRKTNRTIW